MIPLFNHISSLHASPSEHTDRQETQALWPSAIMCIQKTVAPRLPRHFQCWFQQHWATTISKCWHSTAWIWPLSAHTPWSTIWLVFVLLHLPTFTINKEWKSNTNNYLLTSLKLTVSVFLSWNASLEDTGPSTLGRASKHFLYTRWTVDISQEEPQCCFSTIYCIHIYNREQLLVKGQKTDRLSFTILPTKNIFLCEQISISTLWERAMHSPKHTETLSRCTYPGTRLKLHLRNWASASSSHLRDGQKRKENS